MDEKQLIRRLRRGDEQAFRYLVLNYQSQIYNLCYRLLGAQGEAEDIAQEVFIKCFQFINKFRGKSSLRTWLYRVAVNQCKNRLKYLNRRGQGSTKSFENTAERAWSETGRQLPTLGEPAPSPDQVIDGQRAQRRVQQALLAVDPALKELLVLRDVQGLAYGDIIKITGLPRGTVKSRLHRARGELRRVYLELEEQP